MQIHWSHFCTLSIVHFMVFPQCIGGEGPILKTVRTIAEDTFFTGIELTWIKDPVTRRDVRSLLDYSHLRVRYGAQPTLLSQQLDLNSLDETSRQRAVDQLKACIDEAFEIGADGMSFLSGKDPGIEMRPTALEQLLRSVSDGCAYARDAGISLACETFDQNIDKRCLIGPSDYAVAFAHTVRRDHPNFGLLYDLSHQPLLGEKSQVALPLLKDVLLHAHVGNCVLDPASPSYGDTHPRFAYPGGSNGVAELTAFVRALFEIGYLIEGSATRPWIGFEIKPQHAGETPELFIAGTKRIWQEAWAQV